MIPKELLKKVRRIQIRTAHVVNDMLAGQYHSAFKGLGMEFEEVRHYQIGDDVRSIDWNVSARFGEPFVKKYREERELTVMILADISGSQSFGSTTQLKRDATAELCATLAFSAIQNNDKVGLLLFSDQVEEFVPPGKGLRHVLRIIRDVLYHRPQSTRTHVAEALRHLNRMLRRKAVVFVISDFLDSDYEGALRIAKRRHDVIPIIMKDPRERELSNSGLVEFVDAETGETLVVDTSSRTVREALMRDVQRADDERVRQFRRLKLEPITVTTGESIADPLARYFNARAVRV